MLPMRSVLLGVLLLGCSAAIKENPKCPESEREMLKLRQAAESWEACGHIGPSCAALPEIEAKYHQLRKEWVQCRNRP